MARTVESRPEQRSDDSILHARFHKGRGPRSSRSGLRPGPGQAKARRPDIASRFSALLCSLTWPLQARKESPSRALEGACSAGEDIAAAAVE